MSPLLGMLSMLVLLTWCATGTLPGSLTGDFGPSSPGPWLHAGDAGPPRRSVKPFWEEGSAASPPAPRVLCGGNPLPPGWPDLSVDEGQALLTPFLACASPGEFVAFQQRVEMPRLVERMGDWDAVRLSALGPVRSDATAALTRQRAAFVLRATERYGFLYAEVPVLFLLHSAHDDELRELLRLLAGDKQLAQTLGPMPAVCAELARRGLPLSDYPDRPEQARDVMRGLGRSARDALATSPMSDGARGMEFGAIRAQLPPPYQRVLEEVDDARLRQHLSLGHMTVGVFDSLTFGVPVGFYGLVMGTGHGAYALGQGQYEQATRELAPAALMVALYAGGKAGRLLLEARGGPGAGLGLPSLELRLRALQDMARQLETRLGAAGLQELAREIQAHQEAGRFVAIGGLEAAVALHEARGDVARAQAWLSQAKPEGAGPGRPGGSVPSVAEGDPGGRTAAGASVEGALTGEGLWGRASLVDLEVGLTSEVVESRLAHVEASAEGPRLAADVAELERTRPSVEALPPGAEGNPRWSEYVAYRERRLGELKEGRAKEGPLRWEAYERMWGGFARGLAFERVMVQLLRADAALPRAQRRFLGDFELPRVESYVGVWKPKTGLRFADVLVIEQKPPPTGQPPRVETFSFKSRDLARMKESALQAQIMTDARDALEYYGETLDIRRPSLKLVVGEGNKVPVSRVRLIYEGGKLILSGENEVNTVMSLVKQKNPKVEVSIQ